jgi:hypothetical protein
VVKKLIEKCRCVTGNNSYFDWRLLGVEAGACFNAVPAGVVFLNGPLMEGQDDCPANRQRAVRQRRTKGADDDAEEDKPEDIKGHTDRNEDNLSAVQQNIQAVADALVAKVDRGYRSRKAQLAELYGGAGQRSDAVPERALKRLKKNPDQCAVELLFNPKSFTQTVENIFHYSFLVKKGTAALTVRERDVELVDPQTASDEGEDRTADLTLRGGPVVRYVRARDVTPEPRQAIVSLTMEEFRNLVEAYGVEKSDVPHRTGSKHGRATPGAGTAESDEDGEDDVKDEEE